MEDHVRGFLDQAPVVRGCGDRGLDRLLAELLRGARDALVRKRGDVGALRPLLDAFHDGAPELGREATAGAGVARRPRRCHAEQKRVVVAVLADLLDLERVSGRLALLPELLPRAAPEPCLAGLARQPLRLLVHPREHEHAVVADVLDDRGLHRSSTPISLSSLRSTTSRCGSSWRIDASSAADATSRASATCCALPAPPDAITGRDTALPIRSSCSRS